MKSKVFLTVLLLIIFCIPSLVYAAPDQYGYNDQAQIFVGTLENWDNMIFGRPASPVDTQAKDVEFLTRKWNKDFDDAMFHDMAPVEGMWQMAQIYSYPSDKPGWTKNMAFKMVYSSVPIQGAIDMTSEDMPNFYIVQYDEWLTDPSGNKTIVEDALSVKAIPPSLGSGLYKK